MELASLGEGEMPHKRQAHGREGCLLGPPSGPLRETGPLAKSDGTSGLTGERCSLKKPSHVSMLNQPMKDQKDVLNLLSFNLG